MKNGGQPATAVHSSKGESIDVLSDETSLTGIAGFFERRLRRFRFLGFMCVLVPLYAISGLCMGMALSPGIALVRVVYSSTRDWNFFLQTLALGIAVAFAYGAYGLSLIFIVPLANFLLPFRLKPFRGNYYSLASIPWYYHNALTYLVRYTFLEFLTPSPLNIVFFRLMGMKIGKGCQINTTNISDPCLITLEDHVTIAGSAHIFAHYAAQGFLVVAPVRIGKGATIGLKATVMGNVEIGENVKVPPHGLVTPKSRLPAVERESERDEASNSAAMNAAS